MSKVILSPWDTKTIAGSIECYRYATNGNRYINIYDTTDISGQRKYFADLINGITIATKSIVIYSNTIGVVENDTDVDIQDREILKKFQKETDFLLKNKYNCILIDDQIRFDKLKLIS